jgi:hypothetical protein
MTTESIAMHEDVLPEPRRTAARPASAPANGSQLAGTLWFAGWLFTIGYAHLVWWKALLAAMLWPYFLGTSFQ